MRKAVNIRLDENIVLTLERLSKEFNTTKTDIVEKSIKFFSKKNTTPQNTLLSFAGTLDKNEANSIIENINSSKNSKEFTLEF